MVTVRGAATTVDPNERRMYSTLATAVQSLALVARCDAFYDGDERRCGNPKLTEACRWRGRIYARAEAAGEGRGRGGTLGSIHSARRTESPHIPRDYPY